MLVVSAHAADFVWRAGGAVALAASRGDRFAAMGGWIVDNFVGHF